MQERDIKLLENTAIRFVTRLDYYVMRELISSGFVQKDSYPVMEDFLRIKKEASQAGFTEKTLSKLDDIISSRSKVMDTVEKYADIIEKQGISVLCKEDRDYPFSWKELSGMPPVFFAKGDTSILSGITHKGAVSIVGSRQPGRYSLYATREFSSKLSKKGVAVVSGMALGIDRAAHVASMEVGGKTVAVVPGGPDVIYPYKNADIYEKICAQGVLITELPPGQEVLKQYFPSRNRLISALSDACLVMEAGVYSGTLHTASFAAAQSRDVFVLPNSIYVDNCLGGLMLLRDGAEVLIDVDTVYERIMEQVDNRRALLQGEVDDGNDLAALRALARIAPENLSEEQWKLVICDEISEKPRNIDELCFSLGIPFTYLSSMVTILETEGRIANDQGKYVLTIHGR